MNALQEVIQTRVGKVFVALWASTVLCVIAITLEGYADSQFVQAGAVSVLIAGVLANACTITSYWAGAKSLLVARLTWLALSLVALLSALTLLNHGARDADTVMVYALLVLSFPVGFVVGPLIGSLLLWDGSASVVIYWLLNAAIGYLQWFILLPRLVDALRSRNKPVRSL